MALIIAVQGLAAEPVGSPLHEQMAIRRPKIVEMLMMVGGPDAVASAEAAARASFLSF